MLLLPKINHKDPILPRLETGFALYMVNLTYRKRSFPSSHLAVMVDPKQKSSRPSSLDPWRFLGTSRNTSALPSELPALAVVNAQCFRGKRKKPTEAKNM